MCFDVPGELIPTVETGEIIIGTFLERRNEYSGKVEAFSKKIYDKLQPEASVLLQKNLRRIYQTEWDIISVGELAAQGTTFVKGQVETAAAKEEAAAAATEEAAAAAETGATTTSSASAGSITSGGVISGTPTTRGTYTFTVKVTDNNSQTATKELSLKIGYYTTAIDDYIWVANKVTDNVTRIKKSDLTTTTIAVGDAPYNLGDATGYSYDQFFQGEHVDPNLTGRVYDSETGETIPAPVTSIYQKDSTTALSSTTNNPYSFNVLDGYYYFRVEKEGYTFPSNKVNGKVSGDHGENFYASGTSMGIDLPVDQGYPLEIVKVANKKTVVNGDIITYDVKIRNNSMWSFSNINIIDEITNGFKYVDKSTYTDNTQLPETNISIKNRKATFKITNIPGYKETHLTYQVRVGSGISAGEYKTTAVAWDRVRDWRMSNETSCKVTVNPYMVKITEGLLAKVNFGVTQKREANASLLQNNSGVAEQSSAQNKFFIVALGEGIVRGMDTSGNIEMVEQDDRYDKGVSVDGKIALYLKQKIKPGLRVCISS